MEEWKLYFESKLPKSHKRYVIWEVSSEGRIKKNGIITQPRKGKYYMFGAWFVHRAVAELFVPNTDNKPQVDHIDTNRYNNKAENLRWVTNKENCNNPLTKEHISKTVNEFMKSPETRQKIRIARIGTHQSEEAKKKQSVRMTEYWHKKKSLKN